MSLSRRGNTDDFDAWSDGCPDEDPSTAWVRHQVDLTLDQYHPESASYGRLAPIAVTLCVAFFLILLITLALVAQR
jgi:hypothetical protein